ncbi:Lar family restriction alleviation protein [Salmonella enterica]|uniref:Lar family restriction alleviation protein n=1 Tax=Salmonella enterica TaxID=28901 RepID=UPI003D313059
MQKIDYIVTFMGDYPCGGRHPLTVKTNSADVSGAICATTEAIVDDRIEATNLVLISVVPESHPLATEEVNSDGTLKPCPFCGNPHISLVETLSEFDGENTWFVNCGCCNASQLPDSKEGAIRNWNQRDEEDKA